MVSRHMTGGAPTNSTRLKNCLLGQKRVRMRYGVLPEIRRASPGSATGYLWSVGQQFNFPWLPNVPSIQWNQQTNPPAPPSSSNCSKDQVTASISRSCVLPHFKNTFSKRSHPVPTSSHKFILHNTVSHEAVSHSRKVGHSPWSSRGRAGRECDCQRQNFSTVSSMSKGCKERVVPNLYNSGVRSIIIILAWGLSSQSSSFFLSFFSPYFTFWLQERIRD